MYPRVSLKAPRGMPLNGFQKGAEASIEARTATKGLWAAIVYLKSLMALVKLLFPSRARARPCMRGVRILFSLIIFSIFSGAHFAFVWGLAG